MKRISSIKKQAPREGSGVSYHEEKNKLEYCVDPIIEAVRLGLPMSLVADNLGLSNSIIYQWRRLGEELFEKQSQLSGNSLKRFNKKLSPFKLDLIRLISGIRIAKAKRIRESITRIREAATGGKEYTETKKVIKRAVIDGELTEYVEREERNTKVILPSWTADAWYLERQCPEEFGRNRMPQIDDTFDQVADEIEQLSQGGEEGVD